MKVKLYCLAIILVAIAIMPYHASAQTSNLLTIKSDSATVFLESMKIDVRIVGNIATTVVELTYHNTSDSDLEGEFNFPLNERQRVFRFGMDVNGKMREGVMVDKAEGRKAFESIVRRGVDPGLLEKTVGNNYRARVYPIPAEGRKSILIAFEEELNGTPDLMYHLPLSYGLVSNFHIRIELFNQFIKPQIVTDDQKCLKFLVSGSSYISDFEGKEFDSNSSLSFSFVQSNSERVLARQNGDGKYFYLTYNPPVSNTLRKLPESILIVWDVSYSMRKHDLEKELSLLGRYIERCQNVKVNVLAFSNSIVSQMNYKVVNGSWGKLREHLTNSIYDGGTSSLSIDLSKYRVDEALLFSDGVFNLGGDVLTPGKYPIHAISSSIISDTDRLRRIAEGSGGVFLNLSHTTVEESYNQLINSAQYFLSVDYAKGEIAEVYPTIRQRVAGTFSLAGKITGNEASITLNFGNGNEVLNRKKFVIQFTDDSSTIDLSRIWAGKKIQQLGLDRETNKREIRSLASRHNIVTDGMSLIVLDRVEDYALYGIEPPQELKEAYDLIKINSITKSQSGESAIEAKVLEEYEEQANWWDENEKDEESYQSKKPQQTQLVQPQPQVVQQNENLVIDQRKDEGTVSQIRPHFERDPSQLSAVNPHHYTRFISGSVLDTGGGAIPGAHIILKGTPDGTVTDSNGDYKLYVPDEGGTIVLSFIGLKTEELSIPAGQHPSMIVNMTDDVQQLSEVVVTGVSVVVTRSLTASVATVQNVQSLQGRVAGVQITHAAGQVVVRGNTDIKLGHSPLYVVDGVPADEDAIRNLNTGDIQSMSVIKSENATSLYGSRGTDGVIVITTKHAAENGFQLPDSISSFLEGDLPLAEWNPDVNFLDSIISVPRETRYNTYLALRDLYGNAPSFYLIVGSYFISINENQLGLRILTNIAEVDLENHELIKALSYRLIQLGETRMAIGLLQKNVELRGDEPQSYRDLALAFQEDRQYQNALDNFLKVLKMDDGGDDWQDRFPLIKNTVFDEMNYLISRYKKKLDLTHVPKEWIKNRPVDIRVVLDWNSLDSDVDLWVTEPNGEKCFYTNPLTVVGGRLNDDYMDGYGPEVYQLKTAVKGKYKIEIDFFDERSQKISGPVMLQATVYWHYGTKKMRMKKFMLLLEKEKDSLLVGEFQF